MTYLARRAGGVFYVQVRVRFFSGTRTLLRYSLRTASYAEAKTRLFAYLRWLLPMQNPAEIDSDIDLILSQVDAFLKEGSAEDAWHAHHRHHYLKTATALLADWRQAAPCPIRYARFYSRQKQFSGALTALGRRVLEDFLELDIHLPDPDYLKPPLPTFGYVVEGSVVREVLEEDGPSHWPNIAFDLLPQSLTCAPLYDVGDTWGAPSLVPESDPTSSSAQTVPRFAEAPTPTFAEMPAAQTRHTPLLSDLLEKFLVEKHEETDSRKAERDVKPYILFAIHIMKDRPIGSYAREDIRQLCLALPNIPHQKGLQVQSPVARYVYAESNGWNGLKRLSETTIENRYITGLKVFWSWAKAAGYFQGDLPVFKLMGRKNTGALGRDSFVDEEIRALFEMPTFTGHVRGSRNKAGPVLAQDHIYWSYVIMIFTGMRPAEIAQLEIADLMLAEGQGIYYFDLRPFDPAKGRVAREDMKILKTESSARLVPVHPALIELGLLERANKLAKLGHHRLFPDCQPKVLNGSDLKWGHALSKDWQSRKVHVTKRANVSAYSGRHSMADLLRELDVSPHDCEKFLGHSHPGVNGRYGRKGLMPDKVIEAFITLDAPIVRWLRDHLVSARDRIEGTGMLIESWAVKPKAGAF